jgi:hypothetical protein
MSSLKINYENMSDLTLHTISTDVKMLMKELDNCENSEEAAILIYGMYRGLKDSDVELDLKEAIKYSKENWSDLYK